MALAPNMEALTIFHGNATPELTACQISKATMAALRCDPTTWITVLAISSPVDWKRCFATLISQAQERQAPWEPPQERVREQSVP